MTTIALPSSMTYRSGRWRYSSNAQRFVSPLNGVGQSVGRPGDYWACELTLPPHLEDDAMDWAGFLAGLVGGENAAYVGPPMRWNGKPAGFTLAVSGADQAGLSLTVDSNQGNVTIPRGLFLCYETGSFRAMHITTAAVTLNGSGGGVLPIKPAIRKSPANGAAINVTNPTCEMELADPAIDLLTLTDSIVFGQTIQFRERISE